MDSIKKQIEEIITSSPRGTIFFPDSFVGIGSAEAVRATLGRLVKSELLLRVAQGIYCYPKIDKWDGVYLKPSIEEIATAIALRDKVRIIPTGEYVLNMLGLSTQVPGNVLFLTDGSQRKISVGKGKGISFKHTSEMRSFAYKSRLMQMIIFSLKEIGENNLTEDKLQIIKSHLNNVPQEDYLQDEQLAPVWIRKILTTLKNNL